MISTNSNDDEGSSLAVIPKPWNILELRNGHATTLRELQVATEFDDENFRLMKVHHV
jgi:hypothetical protein